MTPRRESAQGSTPWQTGGAAKAASPTRRSSARKRVTATRYMASRRGTRHCREEGATKSCLRICPLGLASQRGRRDTCPTLDLAVGRSSRDDAMSIPTTPAERRAQSRQPEQQRGGTRLRDGRISGFSRPGKRIPSLCAAYIARQRLIGMIAGVGNIAAEQAEALAAVRSQPDLTQVERKRVTGRRVLPGGIQVHAADESQAVVPAICQLP